MGFTALHVLWFLLAFKFTTPELVKLRVSPRITAECGKEVTLNCNVSSSLDGLSVMKMKWLQHRNSNENKTLLCRVDSTGAITQRTQDDYFCDYEDGQLSLVIPKVNPLMIGNYICEIQSNMGAPNEQTSIALKECCGKSEGILTSSGPTCTFSHVYPDGDVHWFQGFHNLSAGSLRHNTSKSIDQHGWMTIYSSLEGTCSSEPYNCSLRSTRSDRYIASTVVQNKMPGIYKAIGSYGVRLQESTTTILCMLILLTVTLK